MTGKYLSVHFFNSHAKRGIQETAYESIEAGVWLSIHEGSFSGIFLILSLSQKRPVLTIEI